MNIYTNSILIYILVFILGSIIGSFLNVVILRHNTGLRSKRSICFSCGKTLTPLELIPIFSFLWQGGKCVKCKNKISSQYFWVELIFGLVSMVIFYTAQDFNLHIWFLKYIVLMVFFGALVSIFVYDIRHKIIPDKWSLLALVLAVIYSSFFGIGFLTSLKSALIVGIPLLLVNLITKGRGMGFGDVKFAPTMGALLGWSSGLAALVVSFWVGAIWSIYLVLRYKKSVNSKTEIPFGPFLILSTFLCFVFSIDIGTIMIWFSSLSG